jgi:hypothetical protein
MRNMLLNYKRMGLYPPAILAALTAITLASCATKYPDQPSTTTTTNTITVDEFFTPLPNGNADDYYVMNDTDDDVDYSYFLDEQDYLSTQNAVDNDDQDPHYRFMVQYVKGGHGYGDHNHIHEFVKGSRHNHGVYIGDRREDWTDSIALTVTEKSEIDTAMTAFLQCAAVSIDSFRVDLKPYRDTFRVRRLAIIASLDSGTITRDSARILLDTAIVHYEAQTQALRTVFIADLTVCITELSADIRNILTPVQYAIWLRHRGF